MRNSPVNRPSGTGEAFPGPLPDVVELLPPAPPAGRPPGRPHYRSVMLRKESGHLAVLYSLTTVTSTTS